MLYIKFPGVDLAREYEHAASIVVSYSVKEVTCMELESAVK